MVLPSCGCSPGLWEHISPAQRTTRSEFLQTMKDGRASLGIAAHPGKVGPELVPVATFSHPQQQAPKEAFVRRDACIL